MKSLTFLFFLAIVVCSCDNNEEIKTEDRLIGNWEHSLTVRGSQQLLSALGPAKYDFKADKTFVKYLGSFNWSDQGTWSYNDDTRMLTLNYKTYTNEISDPKSLVLELERITDKELVFKVDFNDTNVSGEFVEFEFVHYLKK